MEEADSASIGERITVQKGRGCIEVLNWGEQPFGFEQVTSNGQIARIPNKFKSLSQSDGEIWIGETFVSSHDLQVSYKFTLKRDPAIQSTWQPNPTAAYREAYFLLKKKTSKGINGRLILGVHYPAVQSRMQVVFSLGEIKELPPNVVLQKPKRVRIVAFAKNLFGSGGSSSASSSNPQLQQLNSATVMKPSPVFGLNKTLMEEEGPSVSESLDSNMIEDALGELDINSLISLEQKFGQS